jgi:tRNA G10  N-methylase Trm11
MQYKYAKEQRDYSDLSSGRVFYSLPEHPAFPVRLASEIFQRCLAQRERIYGVSTPCSLYDPCCGAAYHLSVLAYLHGEQLRDVIGSDIDEKAVALAKRNLGLISMEGLNERIHELSRMYAQYGKDSHREALQSASLLKERFAALTEKRQLGTSVFRANALDGQELLKNLKPKSVDLVLTDVPYGQHSYWREVDENKVRSPLEAMLEALLGVVSPSGIVAIASDKQQKIAHERYRRIEHFQTGKRRIVILKPGYDF